MRGWVWQPFICLVQDTFGKCGCSLEAQIAVWRLRLQPGGSDCSLEAQIAARRLRLQPGALDCSLEVQIAV